MEGTVIVADREWMSAVTESPIKAGVSSAEGAKDKGVFCFQGRFRNDLGIGNSGGRVDSGGKGVCSGGAVGH
jgi:hypothetical protein